MRCMAGCLGKALGAIANVRARVRARAHEDQSPISDQLTHLSDIDFRSSAPLADHRVLCEQRTHHLIVFRFHPARHTARALAEFETADRGRFAIGPPMIGAAAVGTRRVLGHLDAFSGELASLRAAET